ncbi:MAG TPA: 16S rRNA (guanine(966)-N(2))-methyltransferase RsmD [Anaerolineales bacterium]|nr:16S rRNA (guanine(966)-N(2))-methyltransferase RsmD [Anaerolineales bacterium]
MAGLRVIGGSARGLRLRMVPGDSSRPIGDRVKGALFNILGADVEGSRFLDLFAGTGSVGIEALSRGASSATMIDASPRAIQTIRANLAHTRLEERGEVVHGDSFAYLARTPPEPFDFIYVAPPQYHGLWSRALRAIDTNPGALNPDGSVIAQIHPKEYEALGLNRLVEKQQRRYGNTLLCFFELPGT